MRQITDSEGRVWDVVREETLVAHRRVGARLAFRLAGQEGETLNTPIEFNSADAADLAIRTMGEKELRRRLDWAMTDAGVA